MKKPRAKQARGFLKPFRSCLAVFYVEQVALNRHVLVKRANNNKRRPKGISAFTGRQVELFQPVSRGISRLENVGSAVLAES
jgi:hypothetical protein